MRLARSVFFAVLMASAIPALAADKDSSSPQPAVPAERQATLTRGPYARQFLARAGLLLPQEETRVDLGHVWAPGTNSLNDDVCYTMRTYKVKRTERLAKGESASRGYSTCELAPNFQIRSLLAPEETSRVPKTQSQQK